MAEPPDIAALLEQVPALFGPLVIGSFAAAAIAGVFYHQTFAYVRRFPNDGRFHKAIVWWLLFVSLAALGANIALSWRSLIEVPFLFVRDPSLVVGKPAPWYYDIIVSAPGAAGVASQLFFINRTYKISGYSRPLALGLLAITAAHAVMFVFVTAYGAMDAHRPRMDGSLEKSFVTLTSASLWISASADTFITISLAWSLLRSKRESSLRTKAARDVFSSLLRMSITTGAITSVMAMVTAIVLEVKARNPHGRNTNVFVAFTLILPHVTASVVCGTLHARESRTHPNSSGSASGPRFDGDGIRLPEEDEYGMVSTHTPASARLFATAQASGVDRPLAALDPFKVTRPTVMIQRVTSEPSVPRMKVVDDGGGSKQRLDRSWPA